MTAATHIKVGYLGVYTTANANRSRAVHSVRLTCGIRRACRRLGACSSVAQAPAYPASDPSQPLHASAGTQTTPDFYVGVQPTPAAPRSFVSSPEWSLSHVVGIVLSATLALVGVSIIYLARALKPFLKAAERAMREMEKAAEEMQGCADEMEKMAEMFQADMPPALEAMEDSAREVEELTESLKVLIGPLTNVNVGPAIKRKRELRAYKARMMLASEASQNGAKPPDAVKQTRSEERAESESDRGPMDFFPSWGKVDVTVLTKAMTPFLDNWKVRVQALSSEIQRKSTSATQAIASSPGALINGLVQGSATPEEASPSPAASANMDNDAKWHVPPPQISLQQWHARDRSPKPLPDASRITVDISVDKASGPEAATRLHVSASKSESTSSSARSRWGVADAQPWGTTRTDAHSARDAASNALQSIARPHSQPRAVSDDDLMNAAWAAMVTGKPLQAHLPCYDRSSEVELDESSANSRDHFDDEDHDEYNVDGHDDEKGVTISVRAFDANNRASASAAADELWHKPHHTATASDRSLPASTDDSVYRPPPFPSVGHSRPSGGASRSPAASVVQATVDAAAATDPQSMPPTLHTGHRGVINGVMTSLRVAKNALDMRLGFMLMLLSSGLLDRTSS